MILYLHVDERTQFIQDRLLADFTWSDYIQKLIGISDIVYVHF